MAAAAYDDRSMDLPDIAEKAARGD